MQIGFIGLRRMGAGTAANLLRDRFLALLAQGGEALDWSAIARLAAQDAGAESS